jgi:transcriptional antiterminator NusG
MHPFAIPEARIREVERRRIGSWKSEFWNLASESESLDRTFSTAWRCMSQPTDETPERVVNSDWAANPEPPAGEAPAAPPAQVEVEEQKPDGGPATDSAPATLAAEAAAPPQPLETSPPPDEDSDEPPPQLVWYVLKVQSSREDTIRDALERRVKIQGLQKYFGRIVVPTEKTTEIRNNKKRVVERKTYPGYIMVEMELNEKTWFTVRETPGVGDFVGAHGMPTRMTETEVNQMLGQETAKAEEAPRVRIDVERGDRVKIKDGPFENFEGTVEEVIEARGLVKVMLIIFNRPTPVDLEYWQVERI